MLETFTENSLHDGTPRYLVVYVAYNMDLSSLGGSARQLKMQSIIDPIAIYADVAV